MPANPTPRQGGVAVLSAASFGLQTLHPTDEPVGQWPFCFTHSNLLGMSFENPNINGVNLDYGVSESYEVVDQTTVVFKLRQGVVWHNKPPANGAPLTVEDISTTYEFFKSSPIHGTRFTEIERFEESQPGFVRLKLTKPASHMVNLLRVPQFAILNAKHIEEGAESLRTKAIGTGPFTQEKFQPNQARVYKKNPNYWLKDSAGNTLPYSDGVVHQIIQDPAAALAAFRTGQVDAYKPTSVEQFKSLMNELDVYAQVHAQNCTCNQTVMAFSHRNPLFKDVRVRRAFSLAVDKQEMIETVFGGAASMQGFIAFPYQGLPWPQTIEEMGEWMRFDPAAARQLLDAAGVEEGVSVPMLYAGQISPGGGNATGNNWVESVRVNLREVGVDLALEPQDVLGFNRTHYAAQWNGLSSVGVGQATALDADSYLRFVNTGSGLNASGISDPTLDEKIAKFRAEYDVDAQFEIAQDIEKYVAQDQMLLGIHVPINFGLILWQKHMQNVIDSPAWWITGGAGQMMQEMYLTEDVPNRNIDSF
jgi:peptide/nickel transport system substrate-binding protein